MELKRQCEILGIEEVKELKYGMDFRKPEYRRELFLRWYGLHLKYANLPGLVYLYMPALSEKFNWNQEQKYWFAFINGCTQNPNTTWAVFTHFPEVPRTSSELDKFETWHAANWRRLEYDTDRRYQKGKLSEMVQDYSKHLAGLSQEDFFHNKLGASDRKQHFRNIWNYVLNNFFMYGRLSSFSYIEYLRIMGAPIDFDSLFLDDLPGSKSHRNGILKVCGRDDLEWWDQLDNGVKTHSPEIVEFAKSEGDKLLSEATSRFEKEPYGKYLGYQSLESVLCTFKSSFRPDRRYFNVYTDMSYNRIKRSEKFWADVKHVDQSVFWEIRKETLPEHLRLEDSPHDPTRRLDNQLSKEKQNHFRLTGQPIMMSKDYPEFKNDFEDKYYSGKEPDFFSEWEE